MDAFVDGPVRVTVPATSANLGPGFDAFGLALELRDELTGEVTGEGLAVDVQGEGGSAVPLDERHLVVRAMRAAFADMGVAPPGLRLDCLNVIPHARGLGSSSAAIVGGLALARALVVDGVRTLGDDRLLQLAADLEGHPDNVAPALLGSLVISGREADTWWAVPLAVTRGVETVVFVPAEGVLTEEARGLLPREVPHAAAAANGGRTAVLVVALTAQPDLLWLATRDHLHQEQRRPAMPDSLELVDALRGDGVPAVVSGAGPAVLAFSTDPADGLEARCPQGWKVRRLAVSGDGVRVE